MSPAAELENLRVVLGGRTILDDVSFALRAGELTVLIGPNGAGKSTLLRAMAGIQDFGGQIRLGGKDSKFLPARERARRVAWLAQGGRIHWGLTVAEIVALGRAPHAGGARLTAGDVEIVARVLDACGLRSEAARSVAELSGGERARVLFARALAVEAPLLLVDEPVASLDPAQQIAAMRLLRAETAKGRSVVAVLHDLSLALRYADRVIALDRGRLVADAAPDRLCESGALDRLYGLRFVHARKDGVRLTGAREEHDGAH